MSNLNQERLMALLDYDKENGSFIWKQCNRGGLIGREAGWEIPAGYRYIRIDGRNYIAHRLAWLYIHGDWPKSQIDHINGIKNDNRINNLREATCMENSWNVGLLKKNISGIKGVHFNNKRKRWIAKIRDGAKVVHLGNFKSKECAGEAVKEFREKIHGRFANHGEA